MGKFYSAGKFAARTAGDGAQPDGRPDAGARFAQVNFMVGLDVANADERPRWNSGDFFGNEFGREWSQ
jgi:hypothetical protein